jgi:DNA-binding NarL/FixJ family response regulator
MQREQPSSPADSPRTPNEVSRAEACLRALLAWVGAPASPRRSTSVAKAVNELLEKEPWVVYAAMRRVALSAVPTDVLGERYQLTKRETDVARLLAVGKTNAEIATTLAISEHTARRHTEQVLSKLHLRSRAAVAPLFAEVAAEASDPRRYPTSVPRGR